jgi:hypothetical protein
LLAFFLSLFLFLLFSLFVPWFVLTRQAEQVRCHSGTSHHQARHRRTWSTKEIQKQLDLLPYGCGVALSSLHDWNADCEGLTPPSPLLFCFVLSSFFALLFLSLTWLFLLTLFSSFFPSSLTFFLVSCLLSSFLFPAYFLLLSFLFFFLHPGLFRMVLYLPNGASTTFGIN